VSREKQKNGYGIFSQIQMPKCLLTSLKFPLKYLIVLGYDFRSSGRNSSFVFRLLRKGDFIVAELVDLSSCLTTSRARLTSLSGRTLSRISVVASHLSSALQNYFHSAFDHALMFAQMIFRGVSNNCRNEHTFVEVN